MVLAGDQVLNKDIKRSGWRGGKIEATINVDRFHCIKSRPTQCARSSRKPLIHSKSWCPGRRGGIAKLHQKGDSARKQEQRMENKYDN
mmetsp:Transcript_23729/g.93484  ORF Transcript_23729/g.93484 Transcript_23729/m.93484 type:complete len:88 (-) Transcript_23729:55-318(-)